MSRKEVSGVRNNAAYSANTHHAVTRRGVLSAGLAFSLSGVGSSYANPLLKSELTADSTPAAVLSYLYAGNERSAKGDPLAKHRNIERVRQTCHRGRCL